MADEVTSVWYQMCSRARVLSKTYICVKDKKTDHDKQTRITVKERDMGNSHLELTPSYFRMEGCGGVFPCHLSQDAVSRLCFASLHE